MYCIKCGVKLADTEKKCPLCNTIVCHPDFKQTAERPLYPSNKMPKNDSGSKALNGAVIILFIIPDCPIPVQNFFPQPCGDKIPLPFFCQGGKIGIQS